MASTVDSTSRATTHTLADITPASRLFNSGRSPARQLVIPRRPLMKKHNTSSPTPRPVTISTPEDTYRPATASPEPTPANVASPDSSVDALPAAASTQETVEAISPKEPDMPASTDTAPASDVSEPQPNPEAMAAAEAVPADPLASPAQATPGMPANAQTRQAVQAAEEEAKREQLMEEYIDSKHYFIPINAAARKRSIQMSVLLTLVIFMLSVILIDLLLDAGIILLIQKIPHTNFFSLS